MFELAEHIVVHTVEESIRLLPFLFVTYLMMEFLEHHTGKKAQDRIRKAGKLGPIWGGLLGIMPQCGFSTAASSLYAGRVITVGTLIAVYLSTSDEMLPIMISEAVPASTIARILIVKVLIAMISGLLIELVLVRVLKKKEKDMDIHTVCEEEHCSCEDGMLVSALRHTIHIFGYILLVTLILNTAIELIGEETLTRFFTGIPVLGEMIAALVGLIPNCASSVVITELYLAGMIGAGAMMAGLLVNAGVGILVLLRLNRNWKQDSRIIGMLYGLGVFWGVVIQAAGIAF
ncbi:MAG: arsenic efflux protein [Lachnospiraceae bacterium]|nr:arsenic efflux protein [Lachnospiraceae bacterium]